MLTVQPATGLKHELVTYIGPRGNFSCAICGAVSTAAAPDSLLRTRRGWVWNLALALSRKRYHRKEGSDTCMGQAELQAMRMAKLPARIAAILGKTYTVLGDEFDPDKPGHLCDDIALGLILDWVEEAEPGVIDRNKGKRLIRR